MKTFQSVAPWIVFICYTAAAVIVSWTETTFSFETHGTGKVLSFGLFAAFLAYTVYCSIRENFFGSVRKLAKLHWGRQVGLDLYAGLLLHAAFVYAMGIQGWMFFFWAVPFLIFGNLATLLFLALHFDAVAAVFVR